MSVRPPKKFPEIERLSHITVFPTTYMKLCTSMNFSALKEAIPSTMVSQRPTQDLYACEFGGGT